MLATESSAPLMLQIYAPCMRFSWTGREGVRRSNDNPNLGHCEWLTDRDLTQDEDGSRSCACVAVPHLLEGKFIIKLPYIVEREVPTRFVFRH